MNFIKQLKVKNFFSIKDEIVLDLKASNYTVNNHNNRVFVQNDTSYNKLVSIYGANASGKTTVLKSLVVIGAIVNNENSDNMPLSIKNKFAHARSKTEFSINFVLHVNGKAVEFEYLLILEANKSKHNIAIDNEILYTISNGKRNTFFNRKDRKINIKDIDDNTKELIFNDIKNTISIFNEFDKFDKQMSYISSIKVFLGSIPTLTNINNAYVTTFGIRADDENRFVTNILNDNKLKLFIQKFILSIGIDIDDITVEFNYDENKQITGIKNILLHHSIDNTTPLEYQLESDGTRMLLKLLMDIYVAKKLKTILVIDEFDSVLHSMLVPLLNKLIIDNNIQIIYSTHNIYNMKYLYADEIHFVNKDNNHTTSIVSPKNDKSIEGYENFLSLYENSYLGGLPELKKIFTKIEQDG
ncbi:MAG: AAA family ATPase [Campylobacterota bacterium]|nr:AAA family ATPase [Campylobacterota bacterium]